jgi:hypothetical protein
MRNPAHGRAFRVLGTAVVLTGIAGATFADSTEQLVAYLVVLAAATFPSFLWTRTGALGIPVFPAIALAYIPYFAFPMVSGSEDVAAYSQWEILRSGLTVAMFLFFATLAWRAIANVRPAQFTFADVHYSPSQVARLIGLGLAAGLVFQLAVIYEWFAFLGSFFGMARTVLNTFTTIACFLASVVHAQGILRGNAWRMVVLVIATIIAVSWSSLFLVGGMMFALAAIFGYVIVARRIPWILVAGVLGIVVVLHAGKSDMRAKYWERYANYGGVTSLVQIPQLYSEWFTRGVQAISKGDVEQSAFDRTSLLQMILRVQAVTPEFIDFLHGETYAILPKIIVPRFIVEDKPTTQSAMALLNNRYGLQTMEESSVTAIGWGLVPEAYANYGYLGVFGIAIVVGGFCGWLAWWGARAEVVSLPTLYGIASMMILINIEIDFIQVALTLMQAFVAVFAFAMLYRWLAYRDAHR